VQDNTDLARLIAAAEPLGPEERARLLERDEALAKAHRAAAEKGDTAAPDAKDDVDLHYVCFVKGKDGALWEMDGRRKGPLRRGQLDPDEDVLSEKALTLGPLKFLEREAADLRFSCVALAGSFD
jgi:ubiquitin carboxyl-terminal hydrolase L3